MSRRKIFDSKINKSPSLSGLGFLFYAILAVFRQRRHICGLLTGVVLLMVAGCKRPPSLETSTVLLTAQAIQLSPLVQLPAGKTVHLVVTSRDAVIYSVETDNGQDVAFALPPSGIPRGTALTSANILAALGETVGGSGTIQSLVLEPNDVIWFYFLGGKGRRLHACVGQFAVASEAIQIVADTDVLQAASGMSDALGLARGTLLAGSRSPRLLLRHTDGWSLLDTRPGEAAPLVELLDSATQEGQPFAVNQERYEPAAGNGGNILLMDRTAGMLWSMNPKGEVTLLFSLIGLPQELSLPRPRNKSLVLFAADSALIEGDALEAVHRAQPTTSFPALLSLENNALSAIGREDLHSTGGVSGLSLRIHELVPTVDNDFVAYDASSGQIIKLAYVNK